MTAAAQHVPSPADAPQFFADELVKEIRARGGHVLRMRESGVFALIRDVELARWLVKLGAKAYRPPWAELAHTDGPMGAYKRAHDGPIEWDLWIHIIPVLGEESVWQAAGRVGVETVAAEDYA
jgi:hypothetical protein